MPVGEDYVAYRPPVESRLLDHRTDAVGVVGDQGINDRDLVPAHDDERGHGNRVALEVELDLHRDRLVRGHRRSRRPGRPPKPAGPGFAAPLSTHAGLGSEHATRHAPEPRPPTDLLEPRHRSHLSS